MFSPLVTRRASMMARANEPQTAQPVKPDTAIDPARKYTLAEVADEIGCSYSFARGLCRRGELWHERHGAKYIVTGADLIAYKSGAAVRGPVARPLPEEAAEPPAMASGEDVLGDDGEGDPAPDEAGQAVIDEEAVDSVGL